MADETPGVVYPGPQPSYYKQGFENQNYEPGPETPEYRPPIEPDPVLGHPNYHPADVLDEEIDEPVVSSEKDSPKRTTKRG